MISEAHVARLLQARYPGTEVTVTREPDGLRIRVDYGDASSLEAVIGLEHSTFVAALERASSDALRAV